MRQSKHSLITSCVLLGIALLMPAAEAGERGIPEYRQEIQSLTEVPGSASGPAAGLLNPAAWAIQPSGGTYFAHTNWDATHYGGERWDLAAVLSLRAASFGFRRFGIIRPDGEDDAVREYTFGLGGGDLDQAWGLSYSWGGGATEFYPRHKRASIGTILRRSYFSIGAAGTFDLEQEDNYWQADLGIRPFGPRVTLFADATQSYGESADDITFGYGAEVMPIPGVALAVKADRINREDCACSFGETEVSARISFGFGQERLSLRGHLNENGDRLASTYALDSGRFGAPIWHKFAVPFRYPEMTMKGTVAYRRFQFFDNRRTLLGTLKQIERYADDPTVAGLVLNLSGMSIGAERLWELREQLAGFRARGKKVIIYLDRAGMVSYTFATVADQIWMDPEGGLSIPGINIGRTYVANLLEKVGIGVDELRFFTHKSAFEGFSRTSMSVADREQLQELTDDIYDYIAETVTSARGLSAGAWDELVDTKAQLMAAEALAANLVDSLGTYEDAKRAVKQAPRRSTRDLTAAHLAGVAGERDFAGLHWGEPDRIAVLYGIGECAMDSGIRGPLLAKKIKAARENPRVKAVVLRADSPGGDPLPSDLVSREMLETAKIKPMIVSQGMVAGSGGYWISMYGDSIFTAPISITGSIGVIGAHLWNDGFGEKTGLTYDFVKRGEHADLARGPVVPLIGFSIPDRPMTTHERARAEKWIRDLYQNFVSKVAEGRGMTEAEVDQVGQGRIWTGKRAVANGLADEIGGLWTSLAAAKAAGGIDPATAIKITEAPMLGGFNPNLFNFSPFGMLGLGRILGRGSEADEVEESHARLAHLLDARTLALLTPQQRAYLEAFLRAEGHPLMIMEPLDGGGDLNFDSQD